MANAEQFWRVGRTLLTLGLTAVTAACASLNSKSPEEPATAPPEKIVEYKAIPANTMYSLLVAEMAGQRQRYDVALFHYLDQARKTRDPNVAERALRIAQYIGAAGFAAEASEIWLEVEPDDPGAVQAAAQVALGRKDFDQSLDLYARFYEMTGVAQFDFYAAALLSNDEVIRSERLGALDALTPTYPESGNLVYGQALLLQSLGQDDAAIQRIDQALKLEPGLLPAAVQKARILARNQRVDEAIDWLDKLLDDHPDNKQIAVLRARMLLQLGDVREARNAFAAINRQYPNDDQIILSLALLEEELENYSEAKPLLRELLNSSDKQSEASYYLGRIAASENDPDLAISYYRQIGDSREFLPAQLAAAQLLNQEQGPDAATSYLQERSAEFPQYAGQLRRLETDILIKAGRQQEAFESVSIALEAEPGDTNLRYTRAMLAERLGNMELLESDLRQIIEQNPEHAEALNALGYSLANKTDRFEEAEPLIERAIALQPDNPAIIDSLGWLYFREGKLNEAGPLLLDAWNRMNDHEIAAHLGEWYWATGDKESAYDIWAKGLELEPESEVIHETLQRLGVDPSDL
ncbi:Tetratricopeptide repeat-containing protein [Thalassolituus maritimus]|uniref:Tetratricopeptide repeat-containing protein n=1 Tax=Thalassolituus maritimus TaxID=484498 RepID=A0A1N7J2G9_9GAMM|nr:tetratricopeptide repeat protein [Thalassolituus maritimus]SIS43437.1 Tetratricopeptide repeat-containing protein [Thalassolituus maritimus]